MNRHLMSSARKDWCTPYFIIQQVGAVAEDGWIDLASEEGCSYPGTGTFPTRLFTPSGVFDSEYRRITKWVFGNKHNSEPEPTVTVGLLDSFVWCNPPYGSGLTKLWVNRFVDFVGDDYAGGALLIPARTDTQAFRAAWKFTQEHGVGRVVLIGQRLQFDDCGESAPFPSALFCVGGMGSRLADAVLDEYGGIVVDL